VATDQYLIAIDVGSSSVKLAVASKMLDEKGKVQIYALLDRPAFGLKKGIITDMGEVSSAVYNIVAEAESVIGTSIREVLVGISGFGVDFVQSEGFIPISGQEVDEDDIDRVVYDSLKKGYNLRDKDILQFMPIDFSLDDQRGIKNPLGLAGEKLGCRTLTITAEPSHTRNFSRIFNQAELDIVDKLYMPFVSSDLLLSPRQKSVGSILVDLGYHSTSYVVWQNDEMVGSGVLNIGCEKVTSDLAYGLQTSIEIAEEIKKNHLNLSGEKRGTPEDFEIFDPETQTNHSLNTGKIQAYAQDRVEEIFLLLLKKLHQDFGKSKFSGGMVLTGGGANLKGIHDIARKVTDLTVYKNVYNDREIRFILDFNNDPTYCNVISMLSYALYNPEEIGQNRNIFQTENIKPSYSQFKQGKSRQTEKKGFWGALSGIFGGGRE
jgi:cell division protein FtsA